jgi:FkbM family methyltransferase
MAEDFTISWLLGDEWKDKSNGWYVDVGAWHPEIDSVTHHFYSRGWLGVNIEPVAEWFALYGNARPRDVNLNCAVSDQRGSVTIYVGEQTGLSTLDGSFNFREHRSHTERVEVRTLADICDQYPCPRDRFFAFLKIDVEGHELAVLRGADFDRHRPRVIVAEADKLHADGTPTYYDWEGILLAADYRYVRDDKANRFYVDARP